MVRVTPHQPSGFQTEINHLRYIAGQYDTGSGLYKLQARYYDPSTGRFTQPDPSGQRANPYAYAACNPVNSKDPSGLGVACNVLLPVATFLSGVGLAELGLAAAILAYADVATGPLGIVIAALALLGAVVLGGAALVCGLSGNRF